MNAQKLSCSLMHFYNNNNKKNKRKKYYLKKKKPLDSLTLAFSSASIDTEQPHAKREWIKNKDRERRGQAVPSKSSLNRHADKELLPPPPSVPSPRVRQTFQEGVRVQAYSNAHANK